MKITLPIEPPRTTQKNTVKFNFKTGHTYHTKQFTQARNAIQSELLKRRPDEALDGNLALEVRLYFTPPKAHKKEHWCNVKPDGDNSLAVIADQLEKCGYVVNDSRFVIEHIEKHYADEKGPRIEIEIKEIEQ